MAHRLYQRVTAKRGLQLPTISFLTSPTSSFSTTSDRCFARNLICGNNESELNHVTHGWLASRDFLAMFMPIWVTWVGITRYLNRFDAEDTVHYIMFNNVHILCALAMVIPLKSCATALDDRFGCNVFLWAVLAARVVTAMFRALYIYASVPDLRRPIRFARSLSA